MAALPFRGYPVRRIAFLAFPRLTLLDLVGVYDALRRVGPMRPAGEVTHRIIGTARELEDESGFRMTADGVYEELAPFDLLVVPGGFGTRTLIDDPRCWTTCAAGVSSGRSPACAPARSCSARRGTWKGCAPPRTTTLSTCFARSAARW